MFYGYKQDKNRIIPNYSGLLRFFLYVFSAAGGFLSILFFNSQSFRSSS